MNPEHAEKALACASEAQDLYQSAKRKLEKFMDCVQGFHAFAETPHEGNVVLRAVAQTRKVQLAMDDGHVELQELLNLLDDKIAGEMTRRR